MVTFIFLMQRNLTSSSHADNFVKKLGYKQVLSFLVC